MIHTCTQQRQNDQSVRKLFSWAVDNLSHFDEPEARSLLRYCKMSLQFYNGLTNNQPDPKISSRTLLPLVLTICTFTIFS